MFFLLTILMVISRSYLYNFPHTISKGVSSLCPINTNRCVLIAPYHGRTNINIIDTVEQSGLYRSSFLQLIKSARDRRNAKHISMIQLVNLTYFILLVLKSKLSCEFTIVILEMVDMVAGESCHVF